MAFCAFFGFLSPPHLSFGRDREADIRGGFCARSLLAHASSSTSALHSFSHYAAVGSCYRRRTTARRRLVLTNFSEDTTRFMIKGKINASIN